MFILRDENVVTIDDYKRVHAFDDTEKTYEYPHLKEAADLFIKHYRAGHKIKTYGDYDVDGVTSLSEMRLLGKILAIDLDVLAPDRFSDGYGINIDRVKEFIEEGVDLIITVDNGIAAYDAVKLARDNGIDVIILDHHELSESQKIPPANVVVDPHVTGGDVKTGFEDLCGAGLMLKFAEIVLAEVKTLRKERVDVTLSQMYALAAIGTVADIVSLTEDNRAIVKKGLTYINKGIMPDGLKSFIRGVAGETIITAETISFQIAPAINAAGRLRKNGAMDIVNVFTASAIFAKKIDAAVEKCIEINDERKKLVEEEMQRALSILDITDDDHAVVYVTKLGHPGIMGLVASKLAEAYGRPAFALCGDDLLQGSGRTFGDADIFKALLTCADLMTSFGGHPEACGLKLKKENVTTLTERLNKALPKCVASWDVYYDLKIESKDAEDIFNSLKELEPFGCGNPNPKFLMTMKPESVLKMGKASQHLKLTDKEGVSSVFFNYDGDTPKKGEPVTVVGTLSKNVYNGTISYQLITEAMAT